PLADIWSTSFQPSTVRSSVRCLREAPFSPARTTSLPSPRPMLMIPRLGSGLYSRTSPLTLIRSFIQVTPLHWCKQRFLQGFRLPCQGGLSPLRLHKPCQRLC